MKLFLDTSVLVKKYIIAESGAKRLGDLLGQASVVIVSPVTWIEIHYAFYRTKRDGLLDAQGLKTILKNVKDDYLFFHVSALNDILEEKAVKILEKCPLRSQDAIQLAAALTSGADLFCTADQRLYHASKNYLKNIELIK